jgi:apolipoprotein N-acyltransferase
MVRGFGPVTFDLADATIGSVISYEGAFSRYPRASVRAGAQAVVVATNQASFGDGPASDQFLAMSRMRAAELGVDIVHAAVTGKSAVLHADGRVDGPTGLFTSEVLTARVRVRDAGLTPYARLGDWVQALSVVAGMAVLVEPRVRRRRRTAAA